MTKMTKLVNNNFKKAIITMFKDLKGKGELFKKRNRRYNYIYETQIGLELQYLK